MNDPSPVLCRTMLHIAQELTCREPIISARHKCALCATVFFLACEDNNRSSQVVFPDEAVVGSVLTWDHSLGVWAQEVEAIAVRVSCFIVGY